MANTADGTSLCVAWPIIFCRSPHRAYLKNISVPHFIRLREPWQRLDSDVNSNHITFQRKFNPPSGLAAGQAIRLQIELHPAVEVLSLRHNGTQLSMSTDANIVTAKLDIVERTQQTLQLTLATAQASQAASVGDLAQVALVLPDL